MTAVCRTAGLPRSSQLADDLPSPLSEDKFGLATDDVVFFSPGPLRRSVQAMARVDKAFAAHGVVRHAKKDVTGALSGTAVGIDLVDGVQLWGNAAKVRLLLPSLLQCIRAAALQPQCLAAILGHIQWLDLLNRPLFSILHSCYGFARSTLPGVSRPVPDSVRKELRTVCALSMLWSFDITKGWHNEIIATDASPSFGFGVSRLRCSANLARSVGRLSEKRGDYVTLSVDPDSASAIKDRIGEPHRLPVAQSQFTTVISARATFPGHPGLLEAHAVRLGLEWLGRSPRKFGRRVAMLIDAKAIIGAVAKGRSSSGTLRRQIARISALLLATDTALHPVYVPSEHNPADGPSRGVHTTNFRK